MFKSRNKSDLFSYLSSLFMGGAVFAIGVSPGAFPNYWLDRAETSRRVYSENKYLQENKVKI
jgi:hypothetical protein